MDPEPQGRAGQGRTGQSRSDPPYLVTVTTALSSGDVSLDTNACSASTTAEAATTGSCARCGSAAWPPRPDTVSWKRSEAAIITPGRTPTVPAGGGGGCRQGGQGMGGGPSTCKHAEEGRQCCRQGSGYAPLPSLPPSPWPPCLPCPCSLLCMPLPQSHMSPALPPYPASPPAPLTCGQAGPHVYPRRCLRPPQRPLLHHEAGATSPFLGRLEQQHHTT